MTKNRRKIIRKKKKKKKKKLIRKNMSSVSRRRTSQAPIVLKGRELFYDNKENKDNIMKKIKIK
jgi:hypothetical protein